MVPTSMRIVFAEQSQRVDGAPPHIQSSSIMASSLSRLMRCGFHLRILILHSLLLHMAALLLAARTSAAKPLFLAPGSHKRVNHESGRAGAGTRAASEGCREKESTHVR